MKTCIFTLLSLFLGLLPVCSQNSVQVIPAPQSVSYEEGNYKFPEKIVISAPASLSKEAGLLKEYLKTDFGLTAEIKKTSPGSICLTMDKQKTEHPDQYRLATDSEGIYISASSATGISYGIQTLLQLIHKTGKGYTVPQLTIDDYPAFAWRSFMLDEGRYFHGKKVVKELIDRMARLKLNVFHWHLTDDQGWRIEIKKYPLLTQVGAFRDSTQINGFNSQDYDGTPHGGFYTQKDIKEIVAYAAARHIGVMPEIEMPGHASAAIAAYPWLGTENKSIKVPCRFGVQYNVFNVADPRVIGFLEDVIDEVITLFPFPYIHIGGDEVRYDNWKKSAQVQAYMKEQNIQTPADLQVFFTNRISNLIAQKGKHAMGWNEITGMKLNYYQSDEDTRTEQKLAAGTLVQFWKGDAAQMVQTAERGYSIVNSNNVYTYLDYDMNSIPLEKAYAFNPVPENFPAKLKDKIIGTGCQMWGEWTPNVERLNEQLFPRLPAYAEGAWTLAKNKDFQHFKNVLNGFGKTLLLIP